MLLLFFARLDFPENFSSPISKSIYTIFIICTIVLHTLCLQIKSMAVCSPTWPVLIWGLFRLGISILSLLLFHEFLAHQHMAMLSWTTGRYDNKRRQNSNGERSSDSPLESCSVKERGLSMQSNAIGRNNRSILRSCKGMLGFLGTIFLSSRNDWT